MRIVVTGGLGFIGSQIVSDLIGRGHEVTIVDFYEDVIRSYDEGRFPIAEKVYGSIARCVSLQDPGQFLGNLQFIDPDCVIHAGAWVDTQVVGSLLFDRNFRYLDDLVKKMNGKRGTLVFLSSASVYGNGGGPLVPYAVSKAYGERIVASSKGLKAASFRLFNVFGRDEHHKGKMASVPFQLRRCYEDGHRFKMFYLNSARDFIPVTTVSKVVIDSAEGGTFAPDITKPVYDLGTGKATTFCDLDSSMMVAIGAKKTNVTPVDAPPSLKGYQHFTQGGANSLKNVGWGSIDDDLKEMYG